MKAYTYVDNNKFILLEKKPVIIEETDAIIKVALASICLYDIHIKDGSGLRAKKVISVCY